MRDNEIVGLWEAYLQVHQPKEEVEQLDESGLSQATIRSAVKKRQERVDADYREDTPEGDERGDKGMKKLARSKRQLYINRPREVRMRANEEVEQLDEFAPGLQKPVNNILKGGQEKLKQFGFKVNENPRPTINQQKQYQNINHKPVKEEVENWVNSLIDEGYDLSEYTWEDMYEIYINENRAAARDPEGYEENERRGQSSRQRRMNDPHTGINSPAFQEFMNRQMGRPKPKKKKIANMSEEWRDGILQQLDEISLKTKISAFKNRATREFESDGDNPKDFTKSGESKADITIANIVNKHGKKAGQHAKRAAHAGIFGRKSFSMPKKPVKEQYDLYDIILSHLLDEGYADTNESALVIMANMRRVEREYY